MKVVRKSFESPRRLPGIQGKWTAAAQLRRILTLPPVYTVASDLWLGGAGRPGRRRRFDEPQFFKIRIDSHWPVAKSLQKTVFPSVFIRGLRHLIRCPRFAGHRRGFFNFAFLIFNCPCIFTLPPNNTFSPNSVGRRALRPGAAMAKV